MYFVMYLVSLSCFGGGACEQVCFFFFSSRRRHTRLQGDWSSDVCSSDLELSKTTLSYWLRQERLSSRSQVRLVQLPETIVSTVGAVGAGVNVQLPGGVRVEIGRASCRERV